MKKTFIIVALLATVGCVSMDSLKVAPNSESAIDAQPYTVYVPKVSLNSTGNSLLKGVHFEGYDNSWRMSSYYIGFDKLAIYEDLTTSDLTAKKCVGEYETSSSMVFESCVSIVSKVSVRQNKESYVVSIRPYKRIVKQGRNPLLMRIKLPNFGLNELYRGLAKQKMFFNFKYTTAYPPESLRGNFDRNLNMYSGVSKETQGWLKQYKSGYSLNIGRDMSATMGASFYPYRKGSIVEIKVVAENTFNEDEMSADWRNIEAQIKKRINKVVND